MLVTPRHQSIQTSELAAENREAARDKRYGFAIPRFLK
jgi:hypothetical protein